MARAFTSTRWINGFILLPRRLLIGLVRLYQLTLSPFIGGQCRFHPTCSSYAIEALQQHGALRGSILATGRLLRCQPWCEGGLDPVPPATRSRLTPSPTTTTTLTRK